MPVRIAIGSDDICIPCDWWNAKEGFFGKDPDAQSELFDLRMQMDRGVINFLEIEQDAIYPTTQLYRHIRYNVTKRVFLENICSLCSEVHTSSEQYDTMIDAALNRLCKSSEKDFYSDSCGGF